MKIVENKGNTINEVRKVIEKEVKKILKDRTNKEILSKKYNFNNSYPVCYLINTSNQKDSFAICLDEKQEDALLLNPYTKNEQLKFQIVDYYNFNFDDYFFRYVQNGYEIGKVSMQAHYAMWTQVGEWYPKDIRYKDGMQRYLKYCKDNNISKEKIDRVCGTKMTVDIMKYYKGKEILEIKRIGIDNWDRPVYTDKNGNLYKDVSLGIDSSMSSLCTAVNNEFYGEPECPLKKDIEIKIVNKFVENIKKDKER